MLATLQKLGVVPSFSRPSVSDNNPYSEALFRTLKYTLAYTRKRFEDLEQARAWVQGFVTWYNTRHRHSGIGFVTPEQRHADHDKEILHKRKEVNEATKWSKPSRWR
jgi:transposase InsO family protein